MSKCFECAFLNRETQKSNYVCSIEKMRHPESPGFYIKNPNSNSCSKNFRKKTSDVNTKEK